MAINDTIAAISTSIGDSGIGIVRMSGTKSLEILNKIFKSIRNKDTMTMRSYSMRYGHIVEPVSGSIIDEVIVSFMKAPNTYTREDIVEINCHGGIVPVKRILSILLNNGARLAEPGEFTKRAFLNGRIDLTQAEAVIDVIRSKTDEGMQVAVNQIEGKLSKKIKNIMNRILDVLANIEAAIDFPEEDVEDITISKIKNEEKQIIESLNELILSADKGKIMRDGIDTIIVGKPNVGKSSLLNALIEEKRAIVTEIPGTTRDIIEEYINIEGIPVKLYDTAGIRETKDIIEKIGVEKTIEYINKSGLVIFMIDGSRAVDDEDIKIANLVKNKKVIIVINKSDLPSAADISKIRDIVRSDNIIKVSVNTESGVDKVKKKIAQIIYNGKVEIKDIDVTNVRHRDILIKARESIKNGINTINNGFPVDCASIEFKEAYLKLGEITGDTAAEDIVDRIFSNFCVGK
jgi:tRNA modification GTPase